jgi:hypothetical protein
MRYTEFAKVLVEAKAPKVINTPVPLPVTKAKVEQILRANGYEDFKINGNNLAVVTQIPDGAKKGDFRSSILQDVHQRGRQRILPTMRLKKRSK